MKAKSSTKKIRRLAASDTDSKTNGDEMEVHRKVEGEETREVLAEEEAEEQSSGEDEEGEEMEDEDELQLGDEERIEMMDKLDIEFEALPPDEEDLEDIEGLLTQIFLRADIEKCEMAKAIIARSPFGCVYRPVEECEDEEAKSITYGVLSILPLNGSEKYCQTLTDFLLQRAKKHSNGETFKQFERVLGKEASNIGFLVSERMLNFPAQIAGPAFSSLIDDCKAQPKEERFEKIVVILKIRISDGAESTAGTSSAKKGVSKRKLGKAARKRLAMTELKDENVLFDNSEERLLFTRPDSADFPFFQYPVESEVERSSKFHSIRRDGQIFRPFRRVCLLSKDQLFEFANKVQQSPSLC